MRLRRTQLALASLTVWIWLTGPAALADTGTLSGKLADGKLPSATNGRAYVYAIHLPDGEIRAAGAASRRGAWKLALEPGPYVITASVVRTDKPVVSAIAPVQRIREGRTTRTTVSLKRTRTPRVKKRARRGARAAAQPSAPVGVKRFSGTGPHPQLGRGLAEMLITQLTNTSSGNCEPTVIEVMRRADILREIALSNTINPRSPIPASNLISPAVYLQGTVDTTATTTSWDLELVDAQAGNRIGGDSGTANGLDIFNAAAGIAQRLTDQLCGSDYQVVIEINAIVAAGPYFGAGLLNAIVPARPVGGEPPTSWMGLENVTVSGLSYDAGVPACHVTFAPPGGYARVEIKKSTAPDMVELIWGGESLGTADMVCVSIDGEVVTIPGAALPIMPFQGTQPTQILFPASGGTQQVSGGLPAPGGGWLNSGTVTLIRLPRGTL